jgi:hypothetical protein
MKPKHVACIAQFMFFTGGTVPCFHQRTAIPQEASSTEMSDLRKDSLERESYFKALY